jgi:hypothetical protein
MKQMKTLLVILFGIGMISALPIPPISPAQACARAKSMVGKTPHWWCNEFVNWCYFGDPSRGGSPQAYCTYPHIFDTRDGTIVCGPSVLRGYWHVGIICENLFCDAPFRNRPIRCVPLWHLKTTFRSYSLHFPQ